MPAQEQIILRGGGDVAGMVEKGVLAEADIVSGRNFVEFPSNSTSCIPRRFGPIHQELPKFSIYSLDRVDLNGFRLFTSGENRFTDDSLNSRNLEVTNAWFMRKLTSGATENINFDALQNGCNSAPIVRDGAILLPCSDEPSNFGSWIFRFIPKLLLSAQHAEFVAVMVYQQRWMTDIIRYLGIDCELIHHEPTRQYSIKNPLIPSSPVPQVYFRPETMELLSSLHGRQEDIGHFGDKIYISRRLQAIRNPSARALENETGLVAALTEMGFKEFNPEKFTFAQQIAVFDSARVIVGCGGSNMFGCIFARHAELIVDIESCAEWEHAHANLLRSTSSQWSVVHGVRTNRGVPPHLNWTLDVDTFVAGLRLLI